MASSTDESTAKEVAVSSDPMAEPSTGDCSEDSDSDIAPSMVSILSSSLCDMDTLEVANLELGETEKIRSRRLIRMRELICKRQNFQNCLGQEIGIKFDKHGDIFAERLMLRFLRFKRFNATKAVEGLENFLWMRQTDPDWHQGLGEFDHLENALELLGNGYCFVAPGRDRMGRKVIINLASRLDPNKHTNIDMMKCCMMTFETLFGMDDEAQVRGLCYVFDCRGLTLQHCRIWYVTEAARMLKSCEKNLPSRHRGMFIVNIPYGLSTVVEFAKSFMAADIRRKVHILRNQHDLTQHSDQLLNMEDVLPSELVGEEAKYSAEEMAQMWKQKVMEHRQYLQNLDSLTLVNPPSDNPIGVEGADAKDAAAQETQTKSWYKFWS